MTGMGTLKVGAEPVRLYVAEAAGQEAPGVALYHAWWGLNDDVIAFADRLAAAGFSVLAPDLFGGEVAASIDEADRLSSSVDEDTVDAIALAAIDQLAQREGAGTRIGTVGFSFGGAWAVWAAGRRDQVGASVVYYGSVTGPTLSAARSAVVGHFAEEDPHEPAENVAAFEQGLRDAGREVTIYRYPGTGHWFAEPSRDAYRPEAADLAFDRTVEFLRRELTGGG
jgi:carboxymethylenebutenolidase